jgi:DinB superfamily
MKNTNLSLEKNFFKEVFEEAYYRAAWHGPNLHSSLKGVSANIALKRPEKGRHNIYEITLHTAYWVYRGIHRIRKYPGLRFPVKGTNWFKSPENLTESEWRNVKELLNEFHDQLYDIIVNLDNKEFRIKDEREKQKIKRLIIGIAMHDIYHAGQIQLIKKLIKS